MCGIYGILSPAGIGDVVANRDRLIHRGPDDAGMWANGSRTVALAHRRLSIIDLSEASHQPFASADGRRVIVFNGEIYNYQEIREELKACGHRFRSEGDTEVILAAYDEWGPSCLDRFNGMFAFAIHDQGNGDVPEQLFIARDRAGKKPLYYAHHGHRFVFASELKAIPKEMRGGMDLQALNHYLALGYIPGSLCISSGVRKLPPAHAACFSPDTGALKVWRWWELPRMNPGQHAGVNDLVDEAERLLHDAVRIRLRSDVPVGVLLSGGLDSSLIAASAANASSRPVKTFTIGLPGSKLDETAYAGIVARHFATEHHLLEVPEPSLDILDEFASFIDEPIADSSIIPAYMVSKLTAQHVKVALGGDGGDELFGGYSDYTTAFADDARMGWMPASVLSFAATIAQGLPTGLPGRNRLSALRGGPFQSLVWGSPYFDAGARRRILAPDAVESLGKDFMAPELFRYSLFQAGQDPVDAMTRTHFGSILPDDFLVKVDRASMAVSLEMRAPFLDKNLVEFAFSSLPSEWKVSGAEGRRLQKLLAKRLLPADLDIDRKQGFSIPINDWLRGPDASWKSGVMDGLPDCINPQAVGRLVAGQARGWANGSRLFALIMLSMSGRNLSGGVAS